MTPKLIVSIIPITPIVDIMTVSGSMIITEIAMTPAALIACMATVVIIAVWTTSVRAVAVAAPNLPMPPLAVQVSP